MVPPQKHQLELLFCYLVIALRLNYFKDQLCLRLSYGKSEVEQVRNPGLIVSVGGIAVRGGPSSGGTNVTVSVVPGWSDGEVSSLTVLVGWRSFLNTKLLQTTHFQNF